MQLSATAIDLTDRVRGLDNGADVYLAQPLEPVELIAVVKALLRLREAEKVKQELIENLDEALVEAEKARQGAVAASERTAGLQAVTAAMSQLLTPREIMEFVIREGASALGASAGLIGLITDEGAARDGRAAGEGQAAGDGRAVEIVATYGYDEKASSRYQWIPVEAADPAREAIESQQPVWVESRREFSNRYPHASQIYSQTTFEALAIIPMRIDERTLGALTFSFVEPRQFIDADRSFLLTLTQNCAQALERARLYTNLKIGNTQLEEQVRRRTAEVEQSREQLRQLNAHLQAVREAERKSLSREIHDQVGGALTGLKMDVARIRKMVSDEALKQQMDTLSNTVDNNIHLIRQIATDLRPSLLDDFGVVAAINWQLQEFHKRSGLEYEFKTSLENANVSSDASIALFRIFQETLTNIARHANATRVEVGLEETSDSLILSVHDNGMGISTGKLNASQSLGLAGMRERVHLLKGILDIRGAPGQGTTVRVKIPIQTAIPSGEQLP